jgi:hypothetical protein
MNRSFHRLERLREAENGFLVFLRRMDLNIVLKNKSLRSRLKQAGVLAIASVLFGCAQTPPPSPTAAPDSSIVPTTKPSIAATKESDAAIPAPAASVSATPAQAAKPVQPPLPGALPPAKMSAADVKSIATTSVLTPDGKARYECAKSSSREIIELPSNTLRICSRFPAMGPCQYERDACRAKGGRVIRFDGVEITKEVENEYDRQVQRFRLNAG